MGGRRVIRFGLAAIFLLVVGFGLHSVFSLIDAPSRGVIMTAPTATVAATALTGQKTKHVATKYASFDYPELMSQSPLPAPIPPELLTAMYSYRDASALRLAITIRSIPSAGLQYDASYGFRKSHPDQYKETQSSIGDTTFSIMTDKAANGFGEVAYSTNGLKAAEISLTGHSPDDPAAIPQIFKAIISSWHWE